MTTTTAPMASRHDLDGTDKWHDLARPSPNVESSETQSAAFPALPPLTAQHETNSTDHKGNAKLDEVFAACRDKDVIKLRALTVSNGGLVDDEGRRAAWPLLLGCSTKVEHAIVAWESLERHRDEDQVGLDVHRSFVYYPKAPGESDDRIQRRKQELSDTIVEVLRRHSYLCYFQGYHDIAQVLLLVLGASAAVPAVERLSVLQIRDFMLPTMTGAISHLSLLSATLDAADHELYMHLSQTAPFYFALSATLTLYAHEIQEYGEIARLFDYLLAHESVVSIYFFTIIICSRKKQLMELDSDEHDMLHSILSKLPQPLDLDDLISKTDKLYQQRPPERLKGWSRISVNSVLKTTRAPQALQQQTLSEGRVFFEKHAEEIHRQASRAKQLDQARRLAWRYRRPAVMTGTAVIVAFIAFSLRSKPQTALHVACEWSSRAFHALLQQAGVDIT